MDLKTLEDLRAVHEKERAAFVRLLDLGAAEPWTAMEIVAGWLWLEFTGHDGVMEEINSQSDENFLAIAMGTKAGIQDLKSQSRPTIAAKRIDDILNGIVYFVCEDILQGRVNAFVGHDNQTWIPTMRRRFVPEDERCMFVTFSRGHPLTQQEVYDYFTRGYGNWVENIYIDRTQEHWVGPLYARVIFRAPGMTEAILGGANKMEAVVNGRSMYCRKFIPRR